MSEARGRSPTIQHSGVTKILSCWTNDKFYSCFTWESRRRGLHEVKASKPLKGITGETDTYCLVGRRKTDSSNQGKTQGSRDVMTHRAQKGAEKVFGDRRICEQQSWRRLLEQRSRQTKRDHQRADWMEDLGSKQRAAVGDAGTSISRKRFHLKVLWFQ